MLSACGEVRTAKPSRRPDASSTRRRESSGTKRVALLNKKRTSSSVTGSGKRSDGAAPASRCWMPSAMAKLVSVAPLTPWIPGGEGSEEAGVALDLLDMFLGVARAQEFKTGD